LIFISGCFTGSKLKLIPPAIAKSQAISRPATPQSQPMGESKLRHCVINLGSAFGTPSLYIKAAFDSASRSLSVFGAIENLEDSQFSHYTWPVSRGQSLRQVEQHCVFRAHRPRAPINGRHFKNHVILDNTPAVKPRPLIQKANRSCVLSISTVNAKCFLRVQHWLQPTTPPK